MPPRTVRAMATHPAGKVSGLPENWTHPDTLHAAPPSPGEVDRDHTQAGYRELGRYSSA